MWKKTQVLPLDLHILVGKTWFIHKWRGCILHLLPKPKLCQREFSKSSSCSFFSLPTILPSFNKCLWKSHYVRHCRYTVNPALTDSKHILVLGDRQRQMKWCFVSTAVEETTRSWSTQHHRGAYLKKGSHPSWPWWVSTVFQSSTSLYWVMSGNRDKRWNPGPPEVCRFQLWLVYVTLCEETSLEGRGIKIHPYSSWYGSMDWALASEPKGHQFNSQSGHIPGLQVRSPVRGAQEETTHWCFSPSLSPSLPL